MFRQPTNDVHASRPWLSRALAALLLHVLAPVSGQGGVTYRRWHDVAGGSLSEMYADPNYDESPNHEEVLTGGTDLT